MKKVSFAIDYPPTDAGKKNWNRKYGLNAYYSGKYWSQRKQDADYWHLMTKSAMNRASIKKKPFEKPVIITMYFNDRLDCSNHAAMFKMIEDAMKGFVIADDSGKYVVGSEMYFHDKDYILVSVREA